jgi:hypothetical protein
MVMRPFLAHLFPSPLRARKAAFKPKADAERTLPGLVPLTHLRPWRWPPQAKEPASGNPSQSADSMLAEGRELCRSDHTGTLVGIGLAAVHVEPRDFALCYRGYVVSSAHFALD